MIIQNKVSIKVSHLLDEAEKLNEFNVGMDVSFFNRRYSILVIITIQAMKKFSRNK